MTPTLIFIAPRKSTPKTGNQDSLRGGRCRPCGCASHAAPSRCAVAIDFGLDGGGGAQAADHAEDPPKPLPDARPADTLKAAGVPVARRTVAKYREAMGIASSQERVLLA